MSWKVFDQDGKGKSQNFAFRLMVSYILDDGDSLRVAIEGGVDKENRAATLKIMVGSRTAIHEICYYCVSQFGQYSLGQRPPTGMELKSCEPQSKLLPPSFSYSFC